MMRKEIKNNLDYYNKNAEAWTQQRKDPFNLEKQFSGFIKYFKKGDRIIDIGCAAGFHAPMFLGMGRHLKYEGFDLSPGLVSIAKRRYPQLKFQVGNLVDYKSLPKKKYDGFWASAVLMHIPEDDWILMLNNIQKICKKGAVGFFMIPKSRPVPESGEDNRFFTYWDEKKLKKYTDQVNWKILKWGKRTSANFGEWTWYFVRLP